MRAARRGKEGSSAIYWLIAWRPCVQRAEARKEVEASERKEARKEAARRSSTMVAAEPMAAVERVRPLPDPCMRASEQGRKGTAAQFTPVNE